MSKACSWKVETSSCEGRQAGEAGVLEQAASPSYLAEVDRPPGVPAGVHLWGERRQTQNAWNHSQQGAVAAGRGRDGRLEGSKLGSRQSPETGPAPPLRADAGSVAPPTSSTLTAFEMVSSGDFCLSVLYYCVFVIRFHWRDLVLEGGGVVLHPGHLHHGQHAPRRSRRQHLVT